MAAGAAEPVVEVEVPEGGVEVVAPHQAHYAATEPDTFGVTGRAIDRLLGLNEFVGLALIFLGAVDGCGGGGFALFLGGGVATLGKCRRGAEQQRERGNGEVTQD